MPYDKIKKEDLWGVIGNGPAPDEEVEAVEVQIQPDGKVVEGMKFHVDFAEDLKTNYNEAQAKVMADKAYAEQTKLAKEIQGGINKLLDNEKITYPAGVNEDMFIQKMMDQPVLEETPPQQQSEMLVWYPRNSNVGNGYDDNTAALDPIPHFNVTDLLARFFIQSHAQWGVIKNWRSNIIGCTSNWYLPGTGFRPMHMPMFDYDGKNVKKIIRKDVKTLQKDFGLGNAWVYETRRGFHVYFFCNAVDWDTFHAMLDKVQCCKGYKRSSMNRGYSVLRVSAKYTDFDIKPLYVLPNEDAGLQRLPRKAHTIQALLKLGEECGTHFASMYPQWAHFQQDYKEWRPNTKKPSAKRVKKVGMKKGYYKEAKMSEGFVTASTTTSANVTFNASNTWITTGNGTGTGNNY